MNNIDKMKEEILKLRTEGKTYDEIVEIIGCSKGTVSYHCGQGQKEKAKKRLQKNRKNKYTIITKKIDSFINRKITDFKIRNKNRQIEKESFNRKDGYLKVVENPICYLTGREINLELSKGYQLDHIIPVKKGGENTLENMALACKEANEAKRDLLLEDFIELCKEVCENNGYKVVKEI